jgi:hypothetical protein
MNCHGRIIQSVSLFLSVVGGETLVGARVKIRDGLTERGLATLAPRSIRMSIGNKEI